MTGSRKRLIISVLCGVAAALLMAWYISGLRSEADTAREDALARYGGEQVEVVVATRDIAIGETLGADDVEQRTWLSDLLPKDAVRDYESVMGATVAVPLFENEPVTQAKTGGLATTVSVPDGLCAVSIPSQDVLAVGGAITSGSLVNIYAAGAHEVTLLGEEILVLETSNTSYLAEQESSDLFGTASARTALTWVTLAVDPASVEELITASRSDNLYLVLPGNAVETVETR